MSQSPQLTQGGRLSNLVHKLHQYQQICGLAFPTGDANVASIKKEVIMKRILLAALLAIGLSPLFVSSSSHAGPPKPPAPTSIPADVTAKITSGTKVTAVSVDIDKTYQRVTYYFDDGSEIEDEVPYPTASQTIIKADFLKAVMP